MREEQYYWNIYNWGNIVSYYDPKAGDSGILITYDRNDVDV